MFKYALYKIGQLFVSLFPLPVAYRAAVLFADLQYCLCMRDRRAVQENLRIICGPDVDVAPLAKNVFRNFGKYLAEFFGVDHTLRQDFIRGRVAIEHQEILDAAVARGRGIIILTAHIGNWEMGGLVLGKMGYPMMAVALPHKERAVNELFNEQRKRGGVTVVPASAAIRRCLRALKQNETVALLADRDFSATGRRMTFFGRQTMIPRGAAMFAYRTRATVLPMFMVREPGDRFRIFIDEPFVLPDELYSAGEEKFTQVFMQKQVDVLERTIRKYPDQWMMFRPFWIDMDHGPERITST